MISDSRGKASDKKNACRIVRQALECIFLFNISNKIKQVNLP